MKHLHSANHWRQALRSTSALLAIFVAMGAVDSQAQQRTQAKGENTVATQSTPKPNPDLKSLDRLVGSWKMSGDTQGETRYEWMEGGFFLIQHFDMLHDGRSLQRHFQ